MKRDAFCLAFGFALGLVSSVSAATGATSDEWMTLVMSASAMLFGGGSLWKVGSVAREFGKLEQSVETMQNEVTRLRDRAVIGDVYGADMGRVDTRLRAVERKTGIES